MHKIDATDPEAQSADLVADNIAQLKALFPELITEGAGGAAINVDVLKQLVGDATATDAEEKYGLNWHGKRRARQLALTPSTGTLRPCPEDSVDWDTTQNLMIEGDNLEVLKLLQKSYAGKVKLIYIDPPYNTGKDFVYPDNFQDSIKNYLELTGQVEGGLKVSSNQETSGRFHTDWLNMMYTRLKLARSLLNESGLLFVSIDDGELPRLVAMLDECFGEENFLGCITVQGNPRGRDYGGIARMHDYIVVYARSSEAIPNDLNDPDKEFPYTDARGGFETRELRNRNIAFNSDNRPNLYYPFFLDPGSEDENGFFQIALNSQPGWVEVLPKESQGLQTVWRWGRPKAEENLNTEIAGKKNQNGGYQIVEKYRAKTRMARSIWIDKDVNTEKGTLLVKALFEAKVFSFPKPVEMIQRIVEMGSASDDLVCDFFAGSGTTGHAVMTQNAIDGGRRRFILVQLPEPLDPNDGAQRVASDYCSKLNRPHNIAELTKERLRRGGEKLKTEISNWDGDVGFRVYKLDQSNIRAWQPSGNLERDLIDNVEHIVPGRSEQDVLTELLLKLGLDLCVPIEQRQIAGKTVHAIGGGVLMACLDTRIGKEDAEPLAMGIAEWHTALAPAGDTTCVFRDSAFENDEAKTNLAAILEQHGIHHVRSL